MGHQRLGKLAATKAWRDIVSLIAEGNVSVDTLADAVLDACDKSFALAKDDPAFREAMFLLCKIPMAACEENLSEGLRKIGLDVPDKPERTDIIAAFEDAINNVQRNARIASILTCEKSIHWLIWKTKKHKCQTSTGRMSEPER